MINKLVDGLGGAIGSRFMPSRNQLAFVEFATGKISFLDMIRPLDSIVSQGTILLKGTWVFDCETGTLSGSLSGPGDIWWEQIDAVKRQMTPVSGASIVNLGKVDFASLTPAALQALAYGTTPIPGNDDASNQLIKHDVFAVRTNAGNFAKIKVDKYGYDLKIDWVTYKLASPYHVIGTGYAQPEDIAVTADEKTAYVTERTGNLVKVDLSNANRAAATVIASGMQAPHQIYLDETHQQAYVVEFANPGRLIRIDLNTHAQTVLLNGLNNAIGLLISSDLNFAYISEQSGGGRVSQYSLLNGVRVELASGLTNPFFLTWTTPAQNSMFVAERDPANRVTLVGTSPGTVRQLVTGLGSRPSSVALIDASNLLVCCDAEIDRTDLLAGFIPPPGLFKGIGLVPWNLITAGGLADTTTQPSYPYQFTKDAPFAGALSLQVNQLLAFLSGVRFYRVLVDGAVRLDTWSDLQLNLADGKYEIPHLFTPQVVSGSPGYYPIHLPGEFFYNTDLAMILDSTTLANGLRTFTIEFTDNAGVVMETHIQPVLIDNNRCTASIDMPMVGGISATTDCGMLKYTDVTQNVTIHYVASHPNLFGTYSWRLGRAGKGPVPGVPEASVDGPVSLAPFTFQKQVGPLLGTCTSAAFYAYVYCYARAINGISRQSQYDAQAIIAFALTP
jgi:hypothetical protein